MQDSDRCAARHMESRKIKIMRSCLFVLVPSALLASGLEVDHVTVAGSDVKKLQANLQAVGIASVYGGAHANGTTEMALVSFPDGSYLELMAIAPHAGARQVEEHVWGKFLKENAGPCAWAVREKDIAAEVKRLESRGIVVGAPVRSGRQRLDGVKLEWETSDIGAGSRGTFFPFLIHDFTPRAQRAFPQGKPVTRDFRGITRVVIAVRNLDDAVARYRKAYDLPEPIRQVDQAFGGHLALMGNGLVVLAQPLTRDGWLAQRLDHFGEAPCAFVLGANKTSPYHAASMTRWFGADISWFDPEVVGWRLGFEK
jgi:Glyoxalase-like domain